jgi:hypothetical protein
MLRILTIIAALALMLALAGTASASGPTVNGATKAVYSKVNHSGGYATHNIDCQRTSRTRFYCDFLTHDMAGGWRTTYVKGSADVSYYASRYVVRAYW